MEGRNDRKVTIISHCDSGKTDMVSRIMEDRNIHEQQVGRLPWEPNLQPCQVVDIITDKETIKTLENGGRLSEPVVLYLARNCGKTYQMGQSKLWKDKKYHEVLEDLYNACGLSFYETIIFPVTEEVEC